ISLVSYEEFKNDIEKYIDNAFDKKEKVEKYNIVRRL
ncbi:MAG: molecular chaperone Tir, partial [Pseudoleptotrichia goodfellowii]|nr:molecular chaperone Tir [Pseudoleptotrichia goodfellowii]